LEIETCWRTANARLGTRVFHAGVAGYLGFFGLAGLSAAPATLALTVFVVLVVVSAFATALRDRPPA
jgi:uncharacterized membrane protein YtjA (UPF0391 family)